MDAGTSVRPLETLPVVTVAQPVKPAEEAAEARKGVSSPAPRKIMWEVYPHWLFIAILASIIATTILIVIGAYIGKDISFKGPPEIKRDGAWELQSVNEKLQQLADRLDVLGKLPQQMTFQIPKESIRMELILPDAPAPQAIHVHTRELVTQTVGADPETSRPRIQSAELQKEVEKEQKDSKKSEAKPAPAVKKASESKTVQDMNALPPPHGTEAWKEWQRTGEVEQIPKK